MTRRDKTWTILFGMLIAGIVVGLAATQWNRPLAADDYSNLNVLVQHPSPWGFAAYWYGLWTGRVSGQLMLWIALRNQPFYAVVNGLAFVTLAFGAVAVGLGRWPRLKREDLALVGIVIGALWFGLPAPAETISWITGSIVYLWSAVLTLLMAYPYRRWIVTPIGASGGWARESALGTLLFVGGFLAGCWQEQVVAALAAALLCFLIWTARTRRIRRVPYRLWAGAGGLFVGTAVLVAAPGNYRRAAVINSQLPNLHERLSAIVRFASTSAEVLLMPLYPYLLALMLLGATALLINARSNQSRAVAVLPSVWLLAAGASVLPALASGTYPPRTLSFAAVLLVVSAVSMLAGPGESRAMQALAHWVASAAVAVLLAFVLLGVVHGYSTVRALRRDVAARTARVADMRRTGAKDITLPPLATGGTRWVYYADIQSDPQNYINIEIARHYGVRSVRLLLQPAPR